MIMKRSTMLFSLLLTGLVGCDSSDETAELPFLLDCPSISYASNLTNKSELVIQDEANYIHYWNQIDIDSAQPSPEVNFNQTMLILVSSGERSSSGYQVKITKLEESESNLEVYYTTTSPANNCTQNTVITYPYCLVTAAASDKAVNFIETKEISCL
jgi:hypothetical protein